MDGIEYPVSLKDIDKFENQNQTVSITVFGYDRKIVYPLKNSDNTDREHNNYSSYFNQRRRSKSLLSG